MVIEHHLSERRACRLVGLSRNSYRHPPEADQMTKDLTGKIVEIAQARRRFGYRSNQFRSACAALVDPGTRRLITSARSLLVAFLASERRVESFLES